MANLDHVRLLCSGVAAWNKHRTETDFIPNLTHLDMRRVDLHGAKLERADFDGSRLTDVDLAKAELARARLNGIIATNSRFDGADMREAEFKGADLTRVSLRGATMDEIVSFDFYIRHSDLRDASLRNADMQPRTHIYNSDLRGTILEGVRLDRLVTKRVLIEQPRVAELTALGCAMELANMPTSEEWPDWERFAVKSAEDDFGIIIHNGQTYWVNEGRYDFFISHSTDDKASVVQPLVKALRDRGQNVWYDGLEIKPGDDLAQKIKLGIDSSLFGVVVISKTFFGRRWTDAEIQWLMAKRVFLVLSGVKAESLATLRPELADRYHVPFESPQKVADELIEAIRRSPDAHE